LINQCLSIYKNGLPIYDDYEWATAYKDKLTKSYIDLLEKGFQATLLTDIDKALNFLNRLLEFDPYNEQKLEHYLHILINAGFHEQAYKVFLSYEQKLKDDLSISPSSTLIDISNNFFLQK